MAELQRSKPYRMALLLAAMVSLELLTVSSLAAESGSQSQCSSKLQQIIAQKTVAEPGMPDIIDQNKNMTRFYRSLSRLAAGDPIKVRIGFYGDSNYTMDWGTSSLREQLGKRFGYGGHGFVAGAQPWSWYQHREVEIKTAGGWKSYATSTPRHPSNDYGHSGILGFGSAGASVTYESKDRGSLENRVFDQIEVHYSCRPTPSSFDVIVDGKVVKTIQSQCPTDSYRIEPFKVGLAKHLVKIQVKTGTVYLFGVALERDQPGVVVDGLGVGALNLYRTSSMKPELFAAGLKARSYDLVVFHTGTNMWNPKKHPVWAKTVIQRIRDDLGPDISILFLSPPDFRNKDTKISHPRMADCGREKAAIAAAEGIGFWDYYQAMGGAGSIITWRQKDMVAPDYVHLKEGLHTIMMERFTTALMDYGSKLWLDKSQSCLQKQAANSAHPLQKVNQAN